MLNKKAHLMGWAVLMPFVVRTEKMSHQEQGKLVVRKLTEETYGDLRGSESGD